MAQSMEYKCPCCGGIIEFDSGLQQMKCPYCETTFDPEALAAMDEALGSQKPDELFTHTPDSEWAQGETDAMGVYTCRTCGGEIIADDTTGATHCPYCGNPVVLTGRFSGDLKPDYVIPFKLDKERAKAELKKFMSGKKLLPKLFSTDSHLDEIKGVYVPFWLFDADAQARINYHGTRSRSWRTGNTEYTETQHFHIARAGRMGFARIPVDGASKVPDDMMESIEPFDYSAAIPFKTAYLSGYMADRYDVTAEDSLERVNARVTKSVQDMFRSTVSGYVTVTQESASVQLSNRTAKYAMLPVWLLTTSYQGKQYQFAMNGQTGKFVGTMPVGKKEYWTWQMIYTAIFGAAAWAIMLLLRLL